ncbi:MAG: cell division protein SepF [Firmicutes bacterium]|nr:cell division protein SepF [Bacillota bacterium]
MGFADSFKKVIGLTDIEDDEIVTEEELKAEREKLAKETRRESVREKSYTPSYKEMSSESKRVSGSYQGIGTADPVKRFSATGTGSLKLILIEPKNFDECPKLVDSLKARKPVIINLEKLETEVARKIFDFLSGATYALDGKVQKIANNIFIFTPENVSVNASQMSALSHQEKSPWR